MMLGIVLLVSIDINGSCWLKIVLITWLSPFGRTVPFEVEITKDRIEIPQHLKYCNFRVDGICGLGSLAFIPSGVIQSPPDSSLLVCH
jgi:hypothetical protein